MKKLLFSALLLTGGSFTSQAQVADGSIASDFTVTAYQSWLSTAGMNGNGTYNLYDYTDAGYTVILDVSATWCGPCWDHHLTGALDDLYINHGPAGELGVSGTTTDDVLVIWMDGDGTTADATMLDGQGNSTGNGPIGNWIEPNATLGQIPFPMANPIATVANQINDDYEIAYFPTIYRICPNRTIKLVGQLNATQFYNSVGQCPAPATASIDVAALSVDGSSEICPGEYTPKVTIQNNSTTNLTGATISITLGGTEVSTGTFTGNLAMYEYAQVTCSAIASFNGGTLVATVTTSGDNNAANATKNKVVTVNNSPQEAVTNMVKVDITTDRYANETSWEITNAAGAVIASGGPWAALSANGQTVRPTVNVNNLTPDQCYRFTIYDSFGDGLCCDYGNGAYSVKDVNNNVLFSGSTFTDEAGGLIRAGVLGVNEMTITNFNVYPNPASDKVNVAFEAINDAYEIEMIDLQGRVLSAQTLTGLSGTQVASFDVNEFAKGSYLVKITTNGVSQTQSVVIR